MRLILIILVTMLLFGCSRGESFHASNIQIAVTSSEKVFNTTDDLVKNAITEELSQQFHGTGKKIVIGDTGLLIKVDFDSIQTRFNRNWLLGDNYETELNWNMCINGHIQKCLSTVNISKDGALDRMIGSVSGIGSHPDRRVFPNNISGLVNAICKKIDSVILDLR